MIRYTARDTTTGQVTNAWTSDTGDATWTDSSFPASFTVESEDLAPIQAKADAQAYLDSTDWMVVRAMDNGTPMDADVKAKREAARLVINPTPKGN